MIAHNPEEIHSVFAEAFSRGSLDDVMKLYEPEASLVPQPGKAAVRGHPAIREVLNGFLALQPTLTIRTEGVIQAENLALLRSTWTLVAKGPDGKTIEMTHRATEVVRRQSDGRWQFVIDHPFGAD